MRLRLVFGLLATFALLAGACGDDGGETGGESTPATTTVGGGDGETNTDTTTTADANEPRTASWTGVTEDTIRLGFTTSDLIQLREIGLVDIDRGDPQLVLDALIEDVNNRGGINGRMLEAHLEVLLPIDAAAADEACVRLTEDIEVFAVLAPFVGPNTAVNPCINENHETIIVGGQPTPEQLDRSKAPWISNNMFSDRRLEGVVGLLEAADLLGDKVGVVATIEERAATDDIVIPALEALDKEVVPVVLTVTDGDTTAASAEWDTFLEKFRIEGVDSVVMVENTATFGSSQLAPSGLDANYLIVDSAQLIGGLGNLGEIPTEELAGIIGSSGADVSEQWELEATQDCVRAFEEANPDITVVPTDEVEIGESDWFGNIMIFCAPLRLFELAATAAGNNLTNDSFLAGAEGLGEIDIPGQVFASMGPGKYGAGDAIRLVEFDPSIGENGFYSVLTPLERID